MALTGVDNLVDDQYTSNAYELRKEDYSENRTVRPEYRWFVWIPNIRPMIFEYRLGIWATNITVYKHV